MSSSSTVSQLIRTWRTAFLTLRDETLTPPVRTSLPNLLQTLIFSHATDLVAAAPHLPAHEVTADVLLILELAKNAPDDASEETVDTFNQILCFIRSISQHVSLELSTASWSLMLGSFKNIIGLLFIKSSTVTDIPPSAASVRAIHQCLETLRQSLLEFVDEELMLHSQLYVSLESSLSSQYFTDINTAHGWLKIFCSHSGSVDVFVSKFIAVDNVDIIFEEDIKDLMKAPQGHRSISEGIQLIRFLHHVMECWDTGPKNSINSKLPEQDRLCEVKTCVFIMISEVFSRIGSSSITNDIWQVTLEMLRRMMDGFTSKNPLNEDPIMSRFYVSVLNCLHLVLADPKGSPFDQVASLVAALRLFLTYGLTNVKKPTQSVPVEIDCKSGPSNPMSGIGESKNNGRSPYRPPHLRKVSTMKQSKDLDGRNTSDKKYSLVEYTSESDCSDSDGSVRDISSIQSSKARISAIMCIQDLCRADPKVFSAHWTVLLPTNEVFQSRKHEANLMTCLLHDPSLKARLTSASALSTMLDGQGSVFMQVAEYKEVAKNGSFTALSTSLGLILMQLHKGVLYLIERENHGGLLATLFRILLLLIQSTPYSRMPADLLVNVIATLRVKIEAGFPLKYDQTGLKVAAFNCLTAALSTSPSSLQVKRALSEELSTGGRGILHAIFCSCQHMTNLTVSFEAFQALRSVAHNYPMIITACWDKVSASVYGFLRPGSVEISSRSWNGRDGIPAGIHGEKFISAVIRVLDECLRAVAGFKGTEEQLDDKILDSPFVSECLMTKKISSAPLYGLERSEDLEQHSVETGSKQWSETIERHMPLILGHGSDMVRAASVTCFAGLTSSAFFSLGQEKQEFILVTLINATEPVEGPSVRCAACRAIGVISCFPQICESAEFLKKFIHAAVNNTKDTLVSVRIASSWALANLCDSLRNCVSSHCNSGLLIHELDEISELMVSVTECALRLTKDGDKVKANAVRALGNLSKWVQCSNLNCYPAKVAPVSFSVSNESHQYNSHGRAIVMDPRWLEKMVQAFVSCVTTGNVKVQWNVCHALSNLFLNKSIKLQHMSWAPSVFSILLILLRETSNFKIRIQAAAALAVPATIKDYGGSFADIIQGLEHVIKNFGSDHIQTPSIKYKIALENQLISTMLHMLSLASLADNEELEDFFLKKAPFFEEWLKMLFRSHGQSVFHPPDEISSERKKKMISNAVQSLVELYKDLNQTTCAERFKLMLESLS